MKKRDLIISVMIFLILVLIGIFIISSIMKKTTGRVLKENPDVVKCAIDLYSQKKSEGMVFSSQCLGSCGDYAVDIVHVPRSQEDNKPENQCEDFRNGKLHHFIELDKEGNVVRIV